MSAELDLHGLHQPHEPDPAFVDALEERLHAIVTGGTGAPPVTEDDTAPDLYPRAPAARSDRRRWYGRALLGVAAAVVLGAAIGAVVLRDEPAVVEPFVPVSAANGWVAQSFGNIWLMREGEPDHLVSQEGGVCPAFSPDGRRLMFGQLNRLGSSNVALEIVTVAADGRISPLRTIPLADVERVPCAIWAPDGRWAALADGGAVWVVDTETAEVRRLPGYAPTDLEWRPGTDELAIAGDNGPIDIYTVSTGDVRTMDDVEAAALTWSPDGTTIAYTQAVPGGTNTTSGITLIDADGSNPRPLTTDDHVADHGIGVVWSPRGDQIAYQRERADCTGACDERSEVVLVTATDTDPAAPIGTERVIPPLPDDLGLRNESWSASSVTWSPDGTELLYSAPYVGVIAVPVDNARQAVVLSPDGLVGQSDDRATSPWIPLQLWQPLPIPDPEPATTTTVDEGTQRARDEGSPVNFLAHRSGPSPSGLDAQLYCLGETTPTGSPCDLYHLYDPAEDQHWALEVTQEGQSALFDVRGTPVVEDFDEDSLLVQDGTSRATRFRLLQADGTSVLLRVVSDPAPAAPGPDVMLIEDLDIYRQGSIGPDDPHPRPHVVDVRAGTLQPLDVPEEVKFWGPNVDEFLWGGNDGCRVIWQQPDGSFDSHDIDCLEAEANVYSYPEAGPIDAHPALADWLEPGRMVLLESSDDGIPLVVHASLDRGATWERIEIEDQAWNGTTAQIAAAVADALQTLD